MAVNSIQFLRTTVAGRVPTQLEAGQIAFNITDKVMFVGDGSNVITDLSGNTTAGVTGKGFFASDMDSATAVAVSNAYTDTAISNLIDSAPGVLDTLNELAAALGDDPSFATTITNSINTVQSNLTAEITRAQAAESTNASGISANVTDIATNASDIATNAAAIASNASDIATNTADIATNAAAIASNASDIATLQSDSSTNTSDIATVASDLAAEITRATAAETANANAITNEIARATAAEGTNATAIASNAADIATNAADIATNAAAIASNASDIATNTADIATNASDISGLDTRLSAIEAGIDLGTF